MEESQNTDDSPERPATTSAFEGCFGAGRVTTSFIYSSGILRPHLNLTYYKPSALPMPLSQGQNDETQKKKEAEIETKRKDLEWERSQNVERIDTTNMASDRSPDAETRRSYFRSESKPAFDVGNDELDSHHQADERSNESSQSQAEDASPNNEESSSPDIIQCAMAAATKRLAFSPVGDMTNMSDPSKIESDTDTPFDDNSQAVTMAQKYKSQQSTPSVVSKEKYESMHKTPAYNRSKSHPAKVERQQTPEDYEFMEGAKERRMLYSRSESSGYHTGSKGSQQRSTEDTIDEEFNRDNTGSVRPRGFSGHDRSRESSFEDVTEPKRRLNYDIQLPTVLDSLQSVVNSRASSPSLQLTLPYDEAPSCCNEIPAFVAVESVTPPPSLQSLVSSSISIELEAEFYMNSIDDILQKPVEDATNDYDCERIKSEEIDALVAGVIPDFGEDSRCHSVEHDQLALAIITSDKPSLASMRFFYDKQICEGVYYTDEQLDMMLSSERKKLKDEWMLAFLKNEISIEEIEGYLSDDEDCDKCDVRENDAPPEPAIILRPRGLPPERRAVEQADGSGLVDAAAHARYYDDDIVTDFAGSPPDSPFYRSDRFNSIEPEDDYEIRCLQASALCNDVACRKPECDYGKTLLRQLETFVQRPQTGYSSLKAFCEAILEKICNHSKECEKPNCVVPWCQFFHNLTGDDDLNENVSFADHMVSFLREYIPCVFGSSTTLISKHEAVFEQLQDEGYDSMPIEDHDYCVITRICAFKDVFVANDLRRKAFVVLKRRTKRSESLRVLLELRHLRTSDDNIVQHLWAAHSPSLLLTCMPYFKTDLRTALQKDEYRKGFKSEICGMFMEQLKSVSTYMHDPTRGIMYLNWSSEHILLKGSWERPRLVLFNFDSSSTSRMNKSEMGENLLTYLPPVHVPPEVHANQEVVYPQSDYWGIGCLLYELCCGLPLFHQIAHESFEDQKAYILGPRELSVCSAMSKGIDVFYCLKNLLRKDPTRRRFDSTI